MYGRSDFLPPPPPPNPMPPHLTSYLLPDQQPEHFLSEYPPWYPRISTVRAGRLSFSLLILIIPPPFLVTNPEHFLSEYPPWYPRVSTVRAGRYYSLLRQPKALPPALFPSLLARITGVKPLSYPGQTFPSRPYASHCETSPPQFSVRHVVWERTYFWQTIIFAFSTHYPSPLFTDQPITLSLGVSSMVSPSLHRQG